MINTTLARLFAYATVSISILATPAFAGIIVGINPVLDPGIYSIAGQGVLLDTPNNDNVNTPNNNVLSILQKDYIKVGYVDIVINVEDSGGVTEYVVTENVQNSTVEDWNGYRIELGFGFGGGFVQSSPGDGLDFDTPDEDSPINFSPGAADFTTVTRPSEDELVASDGDLLAGEFSGTDFVFHIDVPDGIGSFTLRQRPTAATAVPEPSSTTLLLLFSGGLLRRRRR